jgi:mRNA interferase RelE/StbE
MTWRVEIEPRAKKELSRLDVSDQRRIIDFLEGRVAVHPNPITLATRLTTTKEDLWRFRVGDHRIIVKFIGRRLLILVVRIGHRGDIYR